MQEFKTLTLISHSTRPLRLQSYFYAIIFIFVFFLDCFSKEIKLKETLLRSKAIYLRYITLKKCSIAR